MYIYIFEYILYLFFCEIYLIYEQCFEIFACIYFNDIHVYVHTIFSHIHRYICHSLNGWLAVWFIIFLGIHELIPAFFEFWCNYRIQWIQFQNNETKRFLKKNNKDLMHQFFPPQRPANKANMEEKLLFLSPRCWSGTMFWLQICQSSPVSWKTSMMTLWHHRVGGWNWRFEDVITVLVIRGLNRFLLEIQQVQTSDVHNLQLAHFFKPNVEPENKKCTTHLSVFWYEHLLKHGWGLSRRGCVSCSFFFQTDIDWCFGVQLEIQNISPVVTRFLCPKLCKILGRAKGFCQPHPYVIPYCITPGLNEYIKVIWWSPGIYGCANSLMMLLSFLTPTRTWRCLSCSNAELSFENFSLGHHQALGRGSLEMDRK